MRYSWLPAVDRRSKGGRLHTAGQAYFRHWDRQSTRWVDEFAANSSCVQKRIQDYYGRSSQVIFPPVDVGYFCPAPPGEPKGDYALAVGRIIGYKRFDLAIEACALAGCRLIVAGHGPEEHRLRALAEKLRSDVEFVIEPGDAVLRNLYRKARLLLFAGEEDFGIVPVEAQACGTPVLAYGTGGVVDTVVHGVTGVLVPEQDACSFATALTSLLDRPLDAVSCGSTPNAFVPSGSARSYGGGFWARPGPGASTWTCTSGRRPGGRGSARPGSSAWGAPLQASIATRSQYRPCSTMSTVSSIAPLIVSTDQGSKTGIPSGPNSVTAGTGLLATGTPAMRASVTGKP